MGVMKGVKKELKKWKPSKRKATKKKPLSFVQKEVDKFKK